MYKLASRLTSNFGGHQDCRIPLREAILVKASVCTLRTALMWANWLKGPSAAGPGDMPQACDGRALHRNSSRRNRQQSSAAATLIIAVCVRPLNPVVDPASWTFAGRAVVIRRETPLVCPAMGFFDAVVSSLSTTSSAAGEQSRMPAAKSMSWEDDRTGSCPVSSTASRIGSSNDLASVPGGGASVSRKARVGRSRDARTGGGSGSVEDASPTSKSMSFRPPFEEGRAIPSRCSPSQPVSATISTALAMPLPGDLEEGCRPAKPCVPGRGLLGGATRFLSASLMMSSISQPATGGADPANTATTAAEAAADDSLGEQEAWIHGLEMLATKRPRLSSYRHPSNCKGRVGSLDDVEQLNLLVQSVNAATGAGAHSLALRDQFLGKDVDQRFASSMEKRRAKAGRVVASYKRLKLKSRGGSSRFRHRASSFRPHGKVGGHGRSSSIPMEIDQESATGSSGVAVDLSVGAADPFDVAVDLQPGGGDQQVEEEQEEEKEQRGEDEEDDEEEDASDVCKGQRAIAAYQELLHGRSFLPQERFEAQARQWMELQLPIVMGAFFGSIAPTDSQLDALRSIFLLHSTLAILPTGSGKSLIYQIAALVLPCLSVVVSPLTSLMEDQIAQLPPDVFCGIALHAAMSPQEVTEVLRLVSRGPSAGATEKYLLLVSPERFCSAQFMSFLLHARHRYPAGLFVVMDEVHCISEWSHNFRPSYLRLQHVKSAMQKEGCPCQFLGLTATLSRPAELSLRERFGISERHCIRQSALRENIDFVFCHAPAARRFSILVELLTREGLLSSVIVYVHFQKEAEHLAGRLRGALGKVCEAFHAGKSFSQKSRIQDLFMKGKVDVLVATVAFGMGLNKLDVRAVVHWGMPRSLEAFVQESGRGGRDGLPCKSIVLFDRPDLLLLRRLALSEAIDPSSVERVVKMVAERCFAGARSSSAAGGASIHCLMNVTALLSELSVPETVVETVLVHLESSSSLGDNGTLRIAGRHPPLAKIKVLRVPAEKEVQGWGPSDCCHVWAVVVYLQQNVSRASRHGILEVELQSVANYCQQDVRMVIAALTMLRERCCIECWTVGNGVLVVYRNAGDAGTASQAQVTRRASAHLLRLFATLESEMLLRLDTMFFMCLRQANVAQRDVLFASIDAYFATENLKQFCTELVAQSSMLLHGGGSEGGWQAPSIEEAFLKADIRAMLHSLPSDGMNERQVAKILLGISSPLYRGPDGVQAFWGKYEQADFETVVMLASKEIDRLRSRA